MITKSKNNGISLSWGAVMIWFSANILSQAAYMGSHGIPYDGNLLIQSLGQWSWLMIVIEISAWILLGGLVYHKLRENKGSEPLIV